MDIYSTEYHNTPTCMKNRFRAEMQFTACLYIVTWCVHEYDCYVYQTSPLRSCYMSAAVHGLRVVLLTFWFVVYLLFVYQPL